MAEFFADTYALVEILKGSSGYKNYSDRSLITTEFNIFELTYALFRDFGSDTMDMLRLVRDEIEIAYAEDRDYIKASELRLLTNKESKNLSLIDCLGYVYAKRHRIKFLTGDREFEYMENVEYVK
ncbi:MAG: twitching motility protein PilT [Candidatus Syntrophoarchaeum caldarius]|uniref:Twitching motility protein PilT n=1 Tax=Candidatus Syntropharchaeum caldarium TaxID=1838285 RepID=A0A1F2P803_9EURY|nr:MAG: twitching motility protein PilT [Candidatus Syntrophoarchaeum caldarius]